MPQNNPRAARVLILAPRGRDAEVVSGVVGQSGALCETVANFDDLAKQIMAGAGIAVIADESLAGADIGPLASWLAAQEPWSDFPFVVMLSGRMSKAAPALKTTLAALGNVVILERPLSSETLGSAAGSALRARRRQYQAREVFEGRQAASDQLTSLNDSLEAKVQDRTKALSQANDRITAEVIERERAQQAMSHYQKMESLGRLTGGVAHDFNNLLNVIQGSMDLLLLTNSDEAVRRRVAIAKSACVRGAKLTSQLLAFARNQTLDLRPLSVGELFNNVVELAKPLLGSGIEILTSMGDGADLVAADGNQMEMALLNLAINARDAMEGKGTLTFKSSATSEAPDMLLAGDYVKIEVSDNGPGMSAEIAAKVFEPFFTTKGVGKGTGLGLSQVYGMAQQSGGAAFARSVEGAGATIEIWLRRAVAETEQGLVDKNDARALDGLRVLLVEDDDLVRAGMADALVSFGCLVRQASCGADGMVELERERPDVLLTDYLMPGMTGAELAAKARALHPGLPVLVATGYADMGAIEDALGGNAVLRKPFQLSDLASAVARLADSTNQDAHA
jgi:signal transduction histidine kinase/ActR/RegA family two-component response regulator